MPQGLFQFISVFLIPPLYKNKRNHSFIRYSTNIMFWYTNTYNMLIEIWRQSLLDDGEKNSLMGLLPDTFNWRMRMRRECRKRFPHHWLKKSKPLINDPGMQHGTCVTHVPWCMSGSLTSGNWENVPGIPGACATRNFTYLARGPFSK